MTDVTPCAVDSTKTKQRTERHDTSEAAKDVSLFPSQAQPGIWKMAVSYVHVHVSAVDRDVTAQK